MTKQTEINGDLETRDYFANRIRDLEMLFCYSQQHVTDLIEYLVADYGFNRDELKERPVIEIWEEIEVLQNEYGLSFDFVRAGTFEQQNIGYFRYQLSYGGPSEEIRFFVDPEHNLAKAEFWLLDWFEGSSIECTQNKTIRSMWQFLVFTRASEFALNDAIAKD